MSTLRERIVDEARLGGGPWSKRARAAFALHIARMALDEAFTACAYEAVAADETGDQTDEAYNLAVVHCTNAIANIINGLGE